MSQNPLIKPKTQTLTSTIEWSVEDWLIAGALERDLSKNTIRFYRTYIEPFEAWCHSAGITSVDELDATRIRRYLQQLPATQSPRTKHASFRVIRAWWYHLAQTGIVTENPFASRMIKGPKVPKDRPRTFDETELTELLRATRKSTHPFRDTAILLLFLDTGIRASELAAITCGDIDLRPESARVLINGKGRKQRMVIVGRAALKALRDYLRSVERGLDGVEPKDPVFVSREGGSLTYSGVRQVIERLAITGKVSGRRSSPHTFRSTHAVEWLRAGGGLAQLQAELGHESISTTQGYLSLIEDDIRSEHQKVSPADKLTAKKRRPVK